MNPNNNNPAQTVGDDLDLWILLLLILGLSFHI